MNYIVYITITIRIMIEIYILLLYFYIYNIYNSVLYDKVYNPKKCLSLLK